MLPLLALLLAFDLASARNEPNVEKRSDLAIKNADLAVTAAREAAQKGDDVALHAALDEVRGSVDLAVESLGQSTTNPRKSRFYKKAELAVGQILRRLDGLLQSAGAFEQDVIKPAREYISEQHDKLIGDIMGKGKTKK